jgi:DNA-binding PadR family transcriptional regulator
MLMHGATERLRRAHHQHHHEGFGPGRHHWERMWFGGPRWGGRRARRGDVRAGLLSVLADGPMHGYDLIRELERRSGGMWSPSPGSVYPTLQMLEDEGLVTAQERDGKRVYSITDAGRTEVEERRGRDDEDAPWEFGLGESLIRFRDEAVQLRDAAMQVARSGTEAQRTRATEILAEARKQLYALLAG